MATISSLWPLMGRTNCSSPQVLLQANDGTGEFSTWVTYPKLCDGRWHRVAGEGGPLFLFYREGWVVEGTLQFWLARGHNSAPQ